jgi:hypothetical protein
MINGAVQQMLRLVIPTTAEFTSMITGHGKTRSYLYRFRIIEDKTCTCKKGPQTVSHLSLESENVTTAKSRLKKHTTKGDNWSVSNDKLTKIYLKEFLQFVKSINFDLLENYVNTLQKMGNLYVKSYVNHVVVLYCNGACCLK